MERFDRTVDGWSRPDPAPARRGRLAGRAGGVVAAAALVLLSSVLPAGAALGTRTNHVMESANRGVATVQNQLFGVSCPSTRLCFAVGYANTASAVPLIERSRGGPWSVVVAPRPAMAKSTSLNAVSCPSTSFCMAVGYVEEGTSGDVGALAERWDGRSWSLVASPSSSDAAHEDLLYGVSCTSPTFCLAVGSSGGSSALVERWDGHAWSVRPSYDKAGGDTQLSAVSCVGASACMAVGNAWSTSAGSPVAERWNGSSAVLSSASGTGSLEGVSCVSSTFCLAVGQQGAPVASALAERWNGRGWTAVPSANVGSNLYGTSPQAVSCSSTRFCLVVGAYGIEGTALPFASTWNGSNDLTLDASVVPSESTASQLEGVSCLSGSCRSVGWLMNALSVYRTLAERGP